MTNPSYHPLLVNEKVLSMSKISATALILTKNEEAGIAQCIRGLQDFDEVIVVDSQSNDKTVEMSKNLGVQVVPFVWNGNYPKKKQWMLSNIKTKHSWVLYVDADESPTDALLHEIKNLDLGDRTPEAAFDIPLEYVFAGKTLKFGHKVVKRALVHKGRVFFPEVHDLDAPGIGEVEGHYQPKPIEPGGRIGTLNNKLRHDDKDPVRTWFDRHNRYSDWEAYLRIHSSVRKQVANARSTQGKLFDAVPCKPLVFFLYSYVMRQGFRDGRAGFDYAFALACYYWQIGLKAREMKSLNSLL